MFKFIKVFILCMCINTSLFADCDWSEIKQVGENFLYPKDCHILVGQMSKELQDRRQQVDLLNKSIDLKDLALQKSDERVNVWRTTSYTLEDRLQKQETFTNWTKWGYFVMGAAAIVCGGLIVKKVNQ
jgi:hypothetical protein